MSKKINFGTINAESLSVLSDFNVAIFELRKLSETRKADVAKVEKEMDDLREKREKAISDKTMTRDEAISAYSLEECYTKIAAINVKYDADCKPYKEAQKKALELVDDSIYYAYVLSNEKGSLGATGTLTLKKGKKSEEIKVEKSLKNSVRGFAEKIGCTGAENETALEKFATTMSLRVSGNKRKNKGDEYVGEKTASQFRSDFIYNFLQYTIIEKGVITQSDNHTLSMTVYED